MGAILNVLQKVKYMWDKTFKPTKHYLNRTTLLVDKKELGCFYVIFAQTLISNNICLTYITPSILIYANALG